MYSMCRGNAKPPVESRWLVSSEKGMFFGMFIREAGVAGEKETSVMAGDASAEGGGACFDLVVDDEEDECNLGGAGGAMSESARASGEIDSEETPWGETSDWGAATKETAPAEEAEGCLFRCAFINGEARTGRSAFGVLPDRLFLAPGDGRPFSLPPPCFPCPFSRR